MSYHAFKNNTRSPEEETTLDRQSTENGACSTAEKSESHPRKRSSLESDIKTPQSKRQKNNVQVQSDHFDVSTDWDWMYIDKPLPWP